MYADPQAITVSANAHSMPRVGVGEGTGEFRVTDAQGTWGLQIRHVRTKRYRHTIRFTATKITADPFIPATNTEVSTSFYLTIDAPKAGFTDAELLAIWTGMSTWLNASSASVVSKLIAGEN